MPTTPTAKQKALGQYVTPIWFAELLFEKYFHHLTPGDLVIDAGTGTGNLLLGIPSNIPAIGIEYDPLLAATAVARTGRNILVGNFRTIPIAHQPTIILSNPPFATSLMEAFLQRSYDLLPLDGQACYILPAYFLQTSQRTMSYINQWSIEVQILPRDIWPRLSHPVVLAFFTKRLKRTLIGLTLFPETAALRALPHRFKHTLRQATTSVWLAVVQTALDELGGKASLQSLYQLIQRKRPTPNPFWREKIRQVVAQHPAQFQRIRPGYYQARTRSTHAHPETLWAHAQ